MEKTNYNSWWKLRTYIRYNFLTNGKLDLGKIYIKDCDKNIEVIEPSFQVFTYIVFKRKKCNE